MKQVVEYGFSSRNMPNLKSEPELILTVNSNVSVVSEILRPLVFFQRYIPRTSDARVPAGANTRLRHNTVNHSEKL